MEDYCFCSGDPGTMAPLVTDVIVSGMEAYVPFSIKTFSPSKPWFDHACFLAVQARERAFRSYQSSPSALTHAAFISARNRCKAHIREARTSFGKRRLKAWLDLLQKKCRVLSLLLPGDSELLWLRVTYGFRNRFDSHVHSRDHTIDFRVHS